MLATYLVLFLGLGGVLGNSLTPDQLSELVKNSAGVLSDNIAEDSLLNTPLLIRKYGYPVESHTLTTEDGYILGIHRIPHGRYEQPDPNIKRPVVIVQHGLLASSAAWLLDGPDRALPYLLADAGYDVWLGNARGNRYCRNHVSLDINSSDFWDFSWHQIGYYDLAAMVDYTIAVSGQPQIHYIGHSQGTTMFFVLASSRPEYNDKFKSVHALAPIAFMSNLKSPLIRLISPFTTSLDFLTGLIGMNEFLPADSEFISEAGARICREEGFFLPVCTNFLFILCGFNEEQLNVTMLPLYSAHAPAGASTKQLVHYGQGVKDGHFRQFDHGRVRNLLTYGRLSPPDYDLGKITAPIALHYSDNDWMADVGDVNQLFQKLASPIGLFRVPMDSFNHLDFMWAKDAKTLLFDRVISLIDAFK